MYQPAELIPQVIFDPGLVDFYPESIMAYDQSGRISLNVHLAVPQTMTTGQDGSHTPNTPEILNSIVSMTSGPFAADFVAGPSSLAVDPLVTSPMDSESPILNPTQDGLTFVDVPMSASNLSSPSTPGSTMSVQAYTSQFIKDGLKMTLQQKLGAGGASSQVPASTAVRRESHDSSSPTVEVKPKPSRRIKNENLTNEDVCRRYRRRERNKVAATKCRNKKKAKTVVLMKESEILDAQNKILKMDITKLEAEKSRLIGVLSQHEPSCVKKLKDIMTARHPESARGFYTSPQEAEDNKPEAAIFRVPLPPASTVTSSSSQNRIPMVRISSPEEQPPSFAEAIEMASQVKEEDEDGMQQFTTGMENYFTTTASAADNFYQQQNHFLAKRTLGHTYLDLDSRCIAL